MSVAVARAHRDDRESRTDRGCQPGIVIARTVVRDLHEVRREVGPRPLQPELLLPPGVCEQQHREPDHPHTEHEGGAVRIGRTLTDGRREHRDLDPGSLLPLRALRGERVTGPGRQ